MRLPRLRLQAADRSGAPLGLDAALAALPLLREAAAGGQPHTVVTQEVGWPRRAGRELRH